MGNFLNLLQITKGDLFQPYYHPPLIPSRKDNQIHPNKPICKINGTL